MIFSLQNIIALKHGFNFLNRLGMKQIEQRTHILVQHLYNNMVSLKHYNGNSICKIYGKHELNNSSMQVSFLAFYY